MDSKIFSTSTNDEIISSAFSTHIYTISSSRSLRSRRDTNLRRYVTSKSLQPATLANKYTDNDLEVPSWRRDRGTAPLLDPACDPNSVDSSPSHHPLRKCIHGTSLANVKTAGVETLTDKGSLEHCSDKHFQISFDQTIETKQRENSSSQITSLQLRKHVPRIIEGPTRDYSSSQTNCSNPRAGSNVLRESCHGSSNQR